MFRRHLVAALTFAAIATSLVGCSKKSTSSLAPIDLSPPATPSNIHGFTDASISRDWVMWDASASANVGSYEIYMGASAPGELVATVDANTNSFMLPLNGTPVTEYYRVRAVSINNVPSAFTSSLSLDRAVWDGQVGPNTGGNKGFDSGN